MKNVSVPLMLMRPIVLPAWFTNQSALSGPTAIDSGDLILAEAKGVVVPTLWL